MPILPSGTSASVTPLGGASARFDTATLHRWLGKAFEDFYNALFDAACASGSAQAHDALCELLRQARAQQDAIVEGACTDIALLLADSVGGGVVVPISLAAGGDAQRQRSWQRRLVDAFARRCVRLPLGAEHRPLLELAFHRRVIVPLEQLSVGGRPQAQLPAGSTAGSPSEGEGAERIERLISRFRAGGLKLTSGEPVDAAPAAPSVQHAAPVEPAVEAPAPARSRTWLVLLALAALAALVLSGWQLAAQRVGLFIVPALNTQQPLIPAPRVENLVAPVAHAPRLVTEPARAATDGGAPPQTTLPDSPPPAAQTPAADPGPAASAASGAIAASARPAAGMQPDPTPVQLARSPTEERLIEQVQFLMRRGDAALAELRLTEPFPDSAAANYLAVLAIDPAHAGARQGLERVVARYAALVRNARERGDAAQAERLLARARSVLPHATPLLELDAAR